VVICIRVAFKFLQEHPRLFTVTALFACSWMLVLGIYQSAEENKFAGQMSDVASFLDVYIGGLLILEGLDDQQQHHNNIVWLQRGALWLLSIVAVPRAFVVFLNSDQFPELKEIVGSVFGPGDYQRQLGLVVSVALDFSGFTAIALGAKRISGPGLYSLLITILIIYALTLVAREMSVWVTYKPMPAYFLFSFAAAKLALTLTLCGIIVLYAKRIGNKGWQTTLPSLKQAEAR
jgi:hypothetical protein